ncbi:MAG: hypothetical protein ABH814_01645 [bacterium]
MNKTLFWSNPKINIKDPKNLPYITHQTLMFGSLKDIKKLIQKFGKAKVRKVFLEKPINIYTKPAFKFTKKFILNMGNKKLNEKDYVKSIF